MDNSESSNTGAAHQSSNQPLGIPPPHAHLPYAHIHHQHHQHLQQQLQQQLHSFWENQFRLIQRATDFKNHSLPLARIKKIMKADEDVRMISAEAPVLFARACEMFILELTLRSWNHTEENKRRTLQKNDIAAAITRTDIFDFLVDIVPREDFRDEALSSSSQRTLSPAAESLGYYGPPPPILAPHGGSSAAIGRSLMDQALYGQQPTALGKQTWALQQPPPSES